MFTNRISRELTNRMLSSSDSTSSAEVNFSSVETPELICIFSPHESKEEKTVIAVIYILTSSLSIVGAGSILIYAFSKRIVRSPEVHPLFHLALADLILASLWLSGACTWFHNKYQDCFYLDAFGEMAHLASFFLTVNYALTAYMRLREKADTIINLPFSSVAYPGKCSIWFSRICYVLCWLTPLVIMLPLLINGGDDLEETPRDCTLCLLLFDRPKPKKPKDQQSTWWSYGSIALTATLTFSIITLVLLYFMMLRAYRKAVLNSGVLTDIQRANIDAIRNRIFLYVLVFLVCWSPALVVASCDIDPRIKLTSMKRWFTLFVFQGLTAPMQGFFNCIVYGWARKNFREASERRTVLLESDEYISHFHRPSYGSSL